MRSTILLTGASGFVGQAIARMLLQQQHQLVCASRRPLALPGARQAIMPELGAKSDWMPLLAGTQAVIHCAARVHVMRETADYPLQLFREVNVDATLNLARQASVAGVNRFIFLSSVKVNGEQTAPGCPFTEADPPHPEDAYAISKYEAETALLELARSCEMSVTIIRPPLVYGPGVKANFLSMMRWVKRGLPLPLGSIHNQRSFVYLENLASLVLASISHPAAANQIFLASDGQDMSTTELLQSAAAAFDMRSHLLPFPPALLMLLASMAGRRGAAQRLLQSLQVDSGKARRMLGWTPPFTVEQGLRATAKELSKY